MQGDHGAGNAADASACASADTSVGGGGEAQGTCRVSGNTTEDSLKRKRDLLSCKREHDTPVRNPNRYT